jgi:D-alanyl-D-alanine carboxypeptidase (penicillin-binding protein 5/6)
LKALRRVGISLCVALAGAPAVAADTLPEGAALPAAYIVASGAQVLDSHAPYLRRQPASLAKLAGALVIVSAFAEKPAAMQATVTISKRAAASRGTRLGLRAGEQVAAGDLLAAMLIGSTNDACLALAEHIAGSGEKFVQRMNALAGRLKMTDTRFIDPCGFDQPGQHTTAADMLRIAYSALAEPEILRIVGQPAVRIVTQNSGRTLLALNTNALLGRYDGTFGLKTGYTQQAGQCLIAAARRGSTVAIVVILGGKDRWPVTVALLDAAFDRLTGYPRVRSRSTIGEPDY